MGMNQPAQPTEVYQGQFGEYTITPGDRRGVVLYRTGLAVAALAFAVGTGLGLVLPTNPTVVYSLSSLYTLFWLSLGLSLATIHIYLIPLHRLLQGFWLVGGLASLAVAHYGQGPFVETVVTSPQTLLGVGFTFAALTGIFFKEAFCFNRFETKLLTPIVPLLLLGHLFNLLPPTAEQVLVSLWAILFLVFALRKALQPLVPDIGDKSVFDHLKHGQQPSSAA
jgi:uncharacterized integral membrane protein